MNKIVAVEDNLAPVKDFLNARGCQVINIEAAGDNRVDAVVISGSDENLMDMQNIKINAPVINAAGREPQEIWDEITNQ
jgi:hypothetical protein